MPGIMPMKIIKVGSSSQSRVAQACDRCRSKKIRCDGVTPCCSQCANVGFECKTSDKLSRRAFPRGYTESLEERVRQLEAEVRDLKRLLDEKDEKIDLLSKFHNFSTSRQRSATSGAAKSAALSTSEKPDEDNDQHEDTFSIKQPNSLTRTSSRSEAHWAGASSSTSFLDIFREKAAASGRVVPPISPRALFSGKGLSSRRPVGGHVRRPPRLVSDRLVNVYFQEFSPLFPVLYRPAFLQRYREFAECSDVVENYHTKAQLNLVFSVASTASAFGKEHIPTFDNHWQSALNAIIHDNSLATLQCLILAQLCCLCKGDSNRVLYYAGLAIIMSRRLGLHKSQADLSLDALTTELRKRAFWCLYTLDTFTAAYLGLPRLIKDEIVQTETPINVDDEDLCEQRLTSSTTETKMSASLAFFELSRIFARVLDAVYQASSAAGVSLQTVAELSDALDAWQEGLPSHLRLIFSQDRPSTRVTGDRSPLLSLSYYHVRSLLHRPLAASDLGAKAVPSAIAVADSSKHIVQIVQLLEERRMSFALPLSRNEVLVTAGLGLLYQGLTITNTSSEFSSGSSSIVNDNQRLVCGIMSILDAAGASCATEFKALACTLITVDGIRVRRSQSGSHDKSVSPRSSVSQVSAAHSSSSSLVGDRNSHSPTTRQSSIERASPPRAQNATIAQRRAMAAPGKLCFPNGTAIMLPQHGYMLKGGMTPMKSEPSLRAAAAVQFAQYQQIQDKRVSMNFPTGKLPNLDYLPLGGGVSPVPSLTPIAQKPNVFDESNPVQWDQILGCVSTTSTLNDPSMSASPPMDMFSPSPSGIDTSVGISSLGNLEWAGQGPVSATAWTDSTGVSSVFDDSGASLISGDDGRSSIDSSKRESAELVRNVDYITGSSSVDLSIGFNDDLTSLQSLEACLQI